MKRVSLIHVIIILLAAALLLVGLIPAQAQTPGTNLLANPGFEDPYEGRDGSPPRDVAQGWSPWNVPRTDDMPPYQFRQPEYEPAAPDTSRIRSGSNAQLFFSFYETHQAGVFQRVTGITPGTELRFSVYAWIWSSTFENVDDSEEPGDVIVQAGIDPTGGTDATSANIVWSTSAAVEQYDAYYQYAVIATASTNAVTVFVRSTVSFPVRWTRVYLDDALLEVTPESSSNLPAATSTTPPLPIPTITNIPAELPTNTPQVVVLPTDAPPPTNTLAPVVVGEDATPTQEGAGPVEVIPTNTSAPPPSPTSVAATATPTSPVQPTPLPTGIGGPTTPINENFPGTLVHVVQRGDTVGNLARLYGSTIEAIIEANGLNGNALIYVGQNLIIPVRLAAPATSTPTSTAIVVVVTATPDAGVGGGTGGANGTVYTVQPGDTLNRIAARFNTTVTAIAQLNGIANPNRIQAGQTLTVPGTGGPVVQPPVVNPPANPPANPPPVSSYTVQPGDNLYRISLRFGVSMQRIGEANGILNANRIFVGQVLVIPNP